MMIDHFLITAQLGGMITTDTLMPVRCIILIKCIAGETYKVQYLSLIHIFPEDKTTIWCAAIDPEINEHSYIVPGLGDAGDLAYGEKE